MLAAAAVRRAAEDAGTDSHCVAFEAVLAVLLALDVASAVADALLEEGVVNGGQGGRRGAQGLAGEGGEEEGGDAGGGDLHLE